MMHRVAQFASSLSRARGTLAPAACTALAVFAIHVASATARSPTNVDITKFTFAPNEVTVAPGTTVVWANRDEAPHTVTSSDKSFASKGMDTNDRFEHTFTAEGDFGYICSVHPFMTGVVHVRKP